MGALGGGDKEEKEIDPVKNKWIFLKKKKRRGFVCFPIVMSPTYGKNKKIKNFFYFVPFNGKGT